MITDFLTAYPLWVWLAIGGVLLGAELMTGSGWLLWPAACAAAVALFTLTGIHIGFWGELALFSVLTIAAVVLTRKFRPSWMKAEGKDINDRTGDITGATGEAVTNFADGRGRVLVSGAEWAADLEGDAKVSQGAKVKVVEVLSGSRLKVKAV